MTLDEKLTDRERGLICSGLNVLAEKFGTDEHDAEIGRLWRLFMDERDEDGMRVEFILRTDARVGEPRRREGVDV